jgi:hypothetical protein
LWTESIGTTASDAAIFIYFTPSRALFRWSLPAHRAHAPDHANAGKSSINAPRRRTNLHLDWQSAFVINTMEWLSHQQRSEESLCLQRRKPPKAVKKEKEGRKANGA